MAIGYPKSPIIGSSLPSRQARHALRPGVHAPRVDGLDAARHTAVVVGSNLGVRDDDLKVVAVEGTDALARSYGGAGTLTIVRPDGYVGFVARADDDAAVRHSADFH